MFEKPSNMPQAFIMNFGFCLGSKVSPHKSRRPRAFCWPCHLARRSGLMTLWAIGLAGLLLVSGCERDAILPASSQASEAKQAPAGRPQPKLSTIKLWLGPQELLAEQALTPNEIQTGMMFRNEMAENE